MFETVGDGCCALQYPDPFNHSFRVVACWLVFLQRATNIPHIRGHPRTTTGTNLSSCRRPTPDTGPVIGAHRTMKKPSSLASPARKRTTRLTQSFHISAKGWGCLAGTREPPAQSCTRCRSRPATRWCPRGRRHVKRDQRNPWLWYLLPRRE